jgi:hypothetical protein
MFYSNYSQIFQNNHLLLKKKRYLYLSREHDKVVENKKSFELIFLINQQKIETINSRQNIYIIIAD